jgi:glycosyltransferase involved in cell wall biosynthesis
MKENPLISVVMPAYNAGAWISRAIQCMLDQSYSNIELLIADDASTDNTREIIDAFTDPRISVHHNEVNLGYLKTCNKLMASTKGDFLTFQDSDDYSELNRLEIQLNCFRSDPELRMAAANFAKVDDKGEIVSTSQYPESYEELKKSIPDDFPACGATLMVTKEMYEKFGGYDEYFDRIGFEDFYWMARILDEYKTITVPNCLYYYRFNPNSVTSTLTNPKRLIVSDIVRFLVSQRRESGTDALLSGYREPLDKHVEELLRPYKENKVLFMREKVQRHFWNKEYKDAYKLAFRILLRNPFQSRKFYKNLYIYLKPWMSSR